MLYHLYVYTYIQMKRKQYSDHTKLVTIVKLNHVSNGLWEIGISVHILLTL